MPEGVVECVVGTHQPSMQWNPLSLPKELTEDETWVDGKEGEPNGVHCQPHHNEKMQWGTGVIRCGGELRNDHNPTHRPTDNQSSS
jgi:hypothetical protein